VKAGSQTTPITRYGSANVSPSRSRPRYRENSNPDVLAFHEGFADIVALFEHFMYPDLVASEIARARGTSAMDLLSGLAKQFGESTQRGGALRDYSNLPDTLNYRSSFEVHDRGSILVKAVYDAFIAIVERRSAGLIELATGGSGVLEPGALHPTLVSRLTDETIRAARHVLRMCVRAIDYCPPVDLDFGTYLRALITADLAQVDEDRYNYRTAFLESFRRWGLLPRNLRTVSLETLQWQHPPRRNKCKEPEKLVRDPTWLAGLLTEIQVIDWRAKLERETIFKLVEERGRRVHNFLAAEISQNPNVALQLGLEQQLKKYHDSWGPGGRPVEDAEWVKKHSDDANYTCFNVESARVATRVRPGGQPRDEVIIVIKQKRPEKLSNGRYFWFRGGVTLVIDPLGADGKSPEILHAITRSMDPERLERECQYRQGDSVAGLRLAYFGKALEEREPFALLHARAEADG